VKAVPDLNGLNVVITGASGALGSAVTERFHEAGAQCFLPLVETKVPLHLHKPGITTACGIDLTGEEDVESFFSGLPHIWATVNIAGGFLYAPIEETNATLLMKMLNLNVLTTYLSCRASIHRMLNSGRGGRIVNIAARTALRPELGANMSAYAVAKAGVSALTAALAEEVKSHGIAVNALCPSIIDTPENRRQMPDADHAKWISPSVIAAEIMHLVSMETAAISGASIPIYGEV
jgi:NAD(P)-dependent dehydrogenase (short-subunit alcohol dehydrogenase family)